MRFVWLIVLPMCVLLSGCDQAAVAPYVTAGKNASDARMYAEMLRHRDFDQLEAHLDRTARDSHDRDMYEQLAATFPEGDPRTIKVVGLTVPKSADSSSTDVSLEYEFAGQWVLATVAMHGNEGDVATLVGFRVQPMADSLEHLNRFNLDWKT
jgi:hypothetical protein